jgi:hypothetical protein
MQPDRLTLFLVFLIGITATAIGIRNLTWLVRTIHPSAIERHQND